LSLELLPPAGFLAVHRLMDTWEYHSHRTMAETMFEGFQGGVIYADDPEQPRTALICPSNGFYFACGEPRVDLVAPVLPRLRRDLEAGPELYASLYATSAAWREALMPLFATSVCRLGFERAGELAEAPAVPPGFELSPLGAGMAAYWNPAGDRSGLDPWIFNIWGGPEEAVRRSFGFALLQGGLPIAFTAACAIGGGEAEVEVGTAIAFRRRGLATLTVLSFMAESLRRGLEPTWTCTRDNEASKALARRVGYRQTEEVWGFPLR